jgi:hypothetical protein
MKEITMNKFRIALAVTLLALAAVSAVDTASAANFDRGLDVHVGERRDTFVDRGP